MKMLKPYTKQRPHNHKYFFFFSKVFAKADTFFLCPWFIGARHEEFEKRVFLLLGRERKDRKQLSIDRASCRSSRDSLV
jgi:hypothetical protein